MSENYPVCGAKFMITCFESFRCAHCDSPVMIYCGVKNRGLRGMCKICFTNFPLE